MFDEFSKRSKAVRAALDLAQVRDWGDIALADIAQKAGLDLGDLRAEFSSKSDILRAFQVEVDIDVLAKTKQVGPGGSVRDRLFDTMMTRFEVMGPYKPALKRIACYLRRRPGEVSLLACSTLASQYWMLAGSGAKLGGAGAAVRVAGLAAVYSRVFRAWLDDPSPSLDRTMAALDRALNNGERMLATMDTTCKTVSRVLCGLREWKRKARASSKPTPPETDPAPAANI
jgi:AcrR family transcriptional regulator